MLERLIIYHSLSTPNKSVRLNVWICSKYISQEALSLYCTCKLCQRMDASSSDLNDILFMSSFNTLYPHIPAILSQSPTPTFASSNSKFRSRPPFGIFRTHYVHDPSHNSQYVPSLSKWHSPSMCENTAKLFPSNQHSSPQFFKPWSPLLRIKYRNRE